MHIVFCNISVEHAEALAQSVIENKLAACVNLIPGVTSFYRWKGSVQKDSESTLLIKTHSDALEPLMQHIRKHHPYELPEIVAVAVADDDVNPAYLRWVNGQVATEK